MIDRLIDELSTVVGDDRDVTANCPPRPLAPREVDVLRRVATGMTNSEVATALDLTTETVRSYLRSAMRKLDVGNRTAAVHVARQRELI